MAYIEVLRGIQKSPNVLRVKFQWFSRRKKEQRFINKTVDKLICEIMNNASPEKCVLEILIKRNIIMIV